MHQVAADLTMHRRFPQESRKRRAGTALPPFCADYRGRCYWVRRAGLASHTERVALIRGTGGCQTAAYRILDLPKNYFDSPKLFENFVENYFGAPCLRVELSRLENSCDLRPFCLCVDCIKLTANPIIHRGYSRSQGILGLWARPAL
jgi:hypothetical protein